MKLGLVGLLFLSLGLFSCSDAGVEDSAVGAEASSAEPMGRVIILGFDGVEPTIVDEMMAAGELPNLAALRDRGTYTRLRSSNPPQSPTAWSSFTTSKHPGNHGVYDFLRRIPSRYIPRVGFGSVVAAKLAPDGSVSSPPRFENVRQGKSFWQVANEQGAKVKILSVPFAYPAEDLEESCMLAGLGVPDLRGVQSWFFYLSDAITEGERISGGERIPIEFEGDDATVFIEGIRNPRTKKYASVPIEIRVDREGKSIHLEVGDQSVDLDEGTWSKWLEWEFKVSPNWTAHAISRIHALEVGEQVRLYMTCLQFDPEDPLMRISTPNSYAKELEERYGNYKTVGWIYDTHALRQDALTEDLFLQDVEETMTWREMLTLDEIDRGNFDLLISAWTGTDRVAHLFWRYRDELHPMYTEEGFAKYGQAVENTYRRMDEIVGKVMAKLEPTDLLMVLSDHGFHSFRRGFNVNTWLIRNGYLAVLGKNDPATDTNNEDFLVGYDWSRTKAYSLGLGSVFLNQEGREGQGIVAPGDAGALIEEIREKLLELTDPKSGEKVFSAISTRDDYKGTEQADAPDIQLGYAEGYQSTKAAAKGSAPEGIFEDVNDKWSGEHAASDPEITPGVFFSNQAISSDSPHLVDLGVTALTYLGKRTPSSFEGRSILSEQPADAGH